MLQAIAMLHITEGSECYELVINAIMTNGFVAMEQVPMYSEMATSMQTATERIVNCRH